MLKENKYFVESVHFDVIQKLVKDPVIQQCIVRNDAETILRESSISKPVGSGVAGIGNRNISSSQESATGVGQSTEEGENGANSAVPNDISEFFSKIDADAEDEEDQKAISFEVLQEKIETIQKRCIQLEYPLLAEYDFRHDTRNADIKFVMSCSYTYRSLHIKSL